MGDIIVAIYLLVLPSLALILGGSASGSPHAALGTAREMKLVMSYELPLIMAFLIVVIKSAGQISLTAISSNAHVLSISGAIAFLVSLLCVQAKLGFVPFDIAESETEIASGVMIEYSGSLLAIWKIMQAMMLIVLPLFLVMVFLGGFGTQGWPLLAGIGKYLLIVILIVLIKNTNPRVRIDQAMKFFWFYAGTAMVIAVILAMIGNAYSINWL
jgi:NADH-quinone oxidoreductase subunit H